MGETWNEAMVAAVLQKKYGKPEFAFLRQVRNATGYQQRTRTADALSMGLWPSRGLHLHGFEIKVSRSDWAHELKQPGKAEEIARYCHFWWLAVPDAAIVKDGELPMPWGLLECKSGTPRVVKQAPFTEKPQPPTMEFFASLMRSVSEDDTALADVQKLMQKELWAAEERGRKLAEASAKREAEAILAHSGDLMKRVADFEEASGIRIDRYSNYFSGQIGAAVNLIRSERGIANLVDDAAERLKRAGDELREVAAGLRSVRETPQEEAEAPNAL